MVFKCQEDSFLKEYTSEVVTCSPASFEITEKGKKTTHNGFAIVCKDTILFPEGGGQPYDIGFLNDKQVLKVSRQEDKAIHYLTDSIEPGTIVKQTIEWDRRFDHMQQHSGQHLLSAIIEKEYKITTLSWWLGDDSSFIELDSPTFSVQEIFKTEKILNDLIRSNVAVKVNVFDKNTPEETLEHTRSVKGLPEDHKGDIRVITIEGIDSNMCCGTHVSHLSQLQAIKLLHTEKSKRTCKCLVYFLVGNRILNKMEEMHLRERHLTSLLNNGPQQHLLLVDKLLKNAKDTNKKNISLIKDVAKYESNVLKNMVPPPKYYCFYKSEVDVLFVNTFLRETGATETFLCLITGEVNGIGNVVLSGREVDVNKLKDGIMSLLDGKGSGKGNKYQGKVNNLKNIPKVEELLQNYFV